MGKSNSKNYKNTGDAQVDVLNKLEVHEEYHQENDTKLTLILIAVCVILALMVYQLYQRHAKKQAMKIARSVASLQQV